MRTSLDTEAMTGPDVVVAYKSLAQVERAFRSLKTRLDVRPVYVYNADRVRAHVFLCMLAWHVEWHLRRRLAPLLFEDDDRPSDPSSRPDPVGPAQPSDRARAKAATRATPEGRPVHSVETLLADLATLTLNRMSLATAPEHHFYATATPTPVQQKALTHLGVSIDTMFPGGVQSKIGETPAPA